MVTQKRRAPPMKCTYLLPSRHLIKSADISWAPLSLFWQEVPITMGFCKTLFLHRKLLQKVCRNNLIRALTSQGKPEKKGQHHANWIYETFKTLNILIKITQCHCLVRTFLKNGTTDFDETLHVASAWLHEGYGTSGRSGYSPVQKKGGRRPP